MKGIKAPCLLPTFISSPRINSLPEMLILFRQNIAHVILGYFHNPAQLTYYSVFHNAQHNDGCVHCMPDI